MKSKEISKGMKKILRESNKEDQYNKHNSSRKKIDYDRQGESHKFALILSLKIEIQTKSKKNTEYLTPIFCLCRGQLN